MLSHVPFISESNSEQVAQLSQRDRATP